MLLGRGGVSASIPFMDNFVEIARLDELEVGRMKALLVEGRGIVLYHTSRGYFATDSRCPHRGGPLVEGDIVGNEVVCPWHLWSFDIASGICGANPAIGITRHEVRIEDGRIFVRLSEVSQPSSSLP